MACSRPRILSADATSDDPTPPESRCLYLSSMCAHWRPPARKPIREKWDWEATVMDWLASKQATTGRESLSSWPRPSYRPKAGGSQAKKRPPYLCTSVCVAYELAPHLRSSQLYPSTCTMAMGEEAGLLDGSTATRAGCDTTPDGPAREVEDVSGPRCFAPPPLSSTGDRKLAAIFGVPNRPP